jgi:G:T-mismatch repair DNA endonuclease (very short patch repair protein)
LQRVVERDAEVVAIYKRMGWAIHTVWECHLAARLNETVESVADFLGPPGPPQTKQVTPKG